MTERTRMAGTGKTLRIYVAGPYSATSPTDITRNISLANAAALKIAERGHIPFVPHTMLSRWQDDFGVDRSIVMKICHSWLEHCDAVLYLGKSPGAKQELGLAKRLHLKLFYGIEEIPKSVGRHE